MQSFDNEEREDPDQRERAFKSMSSVCPACGRGGHRSEALFCLTCGHQLNDKVYLPADALRASYHLQRVLHSYSRERNFTRTRHNAISTKASLNGNGASVTALAFATYALVPYLGILFCPGAVLMGAIGLIRQRRWPHLGGRKASAAGMLFGIMIFGAQVFLWWILYKVPQWATGVEF